MNQIKILINGHINIKDNAKLLTKSYLKNKIDELDKNADIKWSYDL